MTEWNLSKAFAIEAAKREIYACEDVEKLQGLCVNLMLQTESLREMIGNLLQPR